MFCKALALVWFLAHSGAALGKKSCVPGTFRDGKNCKPCPAGTFQDSRNRSSCSPCPAGSFRASTGASSRNQCIRCPRDKFSSAGAPSCTNCRAGSISLPGSDQCGSCGPGLELKAIGGPCQMCREGFFSKTGRNRLCSRCPDGNFSSKKGSSNCKQCPAGTFRRNTLILNGREDSAEDSTFCARCEAGTYSDKKGSSVCKLCPSGTVSRAGAISCSPCSKGQFSLLVGSERCFDCPPGTDSLGIRPAACEHSKNGCTFETFENAAGECEACMPGFRFDTKKKKCLPCRSTQVSRGGTQTQCKKCLKGKVPLGDESIFEGSGCECAPGSTDDGNGGCRLCPAGFFGSRPSFNKVVIENLARARTVPEPRCQACPKGFFGDKPGMTGCKLCPFNTYQDQVGSTSCKSCPSDSRSPIGISDPTLVLPLRTVCEVDETGCSPGEIRESSGLCSATTCPLKDTFQRGSSCIRCPNGSKYDKKTKLCEPCGRDFVNGGGLSKKCTKCPQNSERSIFVSNRCTCRTSSASGLYGEFKGTCVLCPPGFTNVIPSAVQTICGKCPLGQFSKIPGVGTCESCGPTSITEMDGTTKCLPCANGTRRPRDVFGQLLNECRAQNL